MSPPLGSPHRYDGPLVSPRTSPRDPVTRGTLLCSAAGVLFISRLPQHKVLQPICAMITRSTLNTFTYLIPRSAATMAEDQALFVPRATRLRDSAPLPWRRDRHLGGRSRTSSVLRAAERVLYRLRGRVIGGGLFAQRVSAWNMPRTKTVEAVARDAAGKQGFRVHAWSTGQCPAEIVSTSLRGRTDKTHEGVRIRCVQASTGDG